MSQLLPVPAFQPDFVNIDFESDLVLESKAKVIKDLESSPLLISLDCLLEGAPAHALAAAAALNLGLPFDMIYSLKDSTPQMLSVFFDRLRLHLDPLPAEQFALIPFKVGSKFASVFGLPVVVQQFKNVQAQLKASSEKSSSKTVSDMLKNASPAGRAAIKGKGKRLPAKDPSSRAVKPRNPQVPAQSPALQKRSLQTVLASPLSFTIPRKSAAVFDNEGMADDTSPIDSDVLADAKRLEVSLYFPLLLLSMSYFSKLPHLSSPFNPIIIYDSSIFYTGHYLF